MNTYALYHNETDIYAGRVVKDTDDTIQLNLFSALDMHLLGMAAESDELKTFPKSKCRLFASERAVVCEALRTCQHQLEKAK